MLLCGTQSRQQITVGQEMFLFIRSKAVCMNDQVIADRISNFENRLASPQSKLAVQTMKDPYVFDFIPFKEDMMERDIEQALVKDITKLLLELGTGFAFLGNQYHINVGGDDFYIDLLFYNLNLRCYVVIELKTGEFKPEYAGSSTFISPLWTAY